MGWLNYSNTAALVATTQSIINSQEIITALEGLLSDLKDAETAQHGYIITGQESYLGPYPAAFRNVDRDVERLKLLAAGNIELQHRLDVLRPVIKERLSIIEETVVARRNQGSEAATQIIRTDRGKRLMDQIRQSVLEMRNSEEALLKRRTKASIISSYRTTVSLIIGGLTSLALLVGAGYLIKREMTKRQQAEEALKRSTEELKRSHDKLETRVWERTAEMTKANEELHAEIAQREQAEGALEESRGRMAGIIESATDAIVTVDNSQRVILFNSAAEKMFGYSSQEALGLPLGRFIPERFRRDHQQHIEKFGKTNVTKRSMGSLGAVYGSRANGEEFPIEASISQMESGGQKLFTVILRDITERRRTEERLVEQAALLNHATDAILVRGLDNRILFWNQGAERIYGWTAEEATGRDVREIGYHSDYPQFEQANRAVIEKGEWVGELDLVTKEGKQVITECRWTLVRDEDGQPKSILAINTDITERKKLEAQFLRAQRLESIGTLASGIAHDLNNILSPIMMGVQLLQMKPSDGSSQRTLEVIRQSAERGSDLIKQVLSFARGAEGVKTTLQPKHLIKEIAKVLSETFPKNIIIKHSLPPELATISGDPTQLHQVLMNLCLNARDAMPMGGTLTIAAENVAFDEHYARMYPEAKPGPYVFITVTDTGTGMPPEILDRIFDPFFTTKEQGKGTGLGLSTVQGIVKGHGGFINVYSEPGRGAQFSIYLPALASGEPAQTAVALSNLPSGQGETILIVDDEASVREIARTALEAFGYRVLTASEGVEAVSLYAAHKNEITAVLTDMMMPLMDGPATIRALQKLNPQVRIVASSGLTDSDRAAEVIELGVKTFLPKPYTAEKLLMTLDEMLSQSRQRRPIED
ncbi:MAG: PAS domain S-box protein [Acidobacteria bacterium]|nr:PAS domain S-box protein [Acidobacteriota bacterium]